MSQTDFGYRRVDAAEKAGRVAGVFSSVAPRYDLMNDLMSGGLHRLWKAFAVTLAGVRQGERVLDVASGSGDLALEFARRAGPTGGVWLTDINRDMIERGRDRALDRGLPLPVVQCDAEALPFPPNSFDCVSVAFGLRNMTDKDAALAEMHRVLSRRAGCSCSSSRASGRRSPGSTTGIRSTSCRGSAGPSRAT